MIGDELNILPIPPDAPQQDNASLHPAIIEYMYNSVDDRIIDGIREDNKSKRIDRLLRLVLPTYKCAQHPIEFKWFVPIGHFESIYGQTTYMTEKIKFEYSDKFQDSIDIDRARVDFQDYYEKEGVLNNREFVLPDTIELSFHKYGSLNCEDKAKFDRALEWFSISQDLKFTHPAASFVALISSIEALLESKKHTKCEICGASVHSLVHRFREFIDEYVPGWFPRKEMGELYNLRSSLVHGGEMKLGMKTDALGVRFLKSEQMHRRLSTAVRALCINWLHRR